MKTTKYPTRIQQNVIFEEGKSAEYVFYSICFAGNIIIDEASLDDLLAIRSLIDEVEKKAKGGAGHEGNI